MRETHAEMPRPDLGALRCVLQHEGKIPPDEYVCALLILVTSVTRYFMVEICRPTCISTISRGVSARLQTVSCSDDGTHSFAIHISFTFIRHFDVNTLDHSVEPAACAAAVARAALQLSRRCV